MTLRSVALLAATCLFGFSARAAEPFQGRIEAVVTRGEQSTKLLYTIGPANLRLETVDAKTPSPVNLLDLKSGTLTLVLPHNQSFVRVKNGAVEKRVLPAIAPSQPAGLPGASSGLALPPMPPMPVPAQQVAALKPTGKKEKILGFDCEQYEISERGETIEVWATAALVPFQNYLRAASPSFGPRLLEEQWSEQLKAKKLFPLRVVLHDETPNERFRFEVKAIKPGRVTDEGLFEPPAGYMEVQAPPF